MIPNHNKQAKDPSCHGKKGGFDVAKAFSPLLNTHKVVKQYTLQDPDCQDNLLGPKVR